MYFTSNLRFLRKRKRRTQEDVSAALGIKRPTYNGYENEVAEPSIDTLIACSKFFNISIDSLVRIDLSKLSEFQLGELERGNDAYLSGTKLRVLATAVNKDNADNIELVSEKAKRGLCHRFCRS